MKTMWKVWKYSLGSFSDEETKNYDNHIAVVRTCIVLVNFVTCFFLMANIVKNW